jgi:2,3-bisphosphoglycerate-independent phosphoglycerate mutase
MITSDHGHAEEMINLRTAEISPEHSINPVPFYLVDEDYKKIIPDDTRLKQGSCQGIISDVAPTILEYMQISAPLEMTGRSLLEILK